MTALCTIIAASGVLACSGPPAEAQPAPCSGAEYKALDFWTGEWTAILPAGAPLPGRGAADADIPAADAAVESILDGCVYLEHWDSAPLPDGQVNRGKGFHRYDAATGKWRQVWVNNSGRESVSTGEPYEGGVRYFSEITGPDGATTHRRQTIVPASDGSVRNYSEASSDGGKTWSVSYEFVYRRKETER